MKPKRRLTAEAVRSVTETLLLDNYDEPVAVPLFHMQIWELLCAPGHTHCAIAAPRKHAKSTAVSHAYVLVNLLFRYKKNVLIISNTIEQAMGFLTGIKRELTENEDLKKLFKISHLEVDAKKEIIIKFTDGEWGRVVARGSGQSLRGAIHNSVRPDLVVCDDLEDDDVCQDDTLRAAFLKWFLKTLLPIRSHSGQIVFIGTILHVDSLLNKLLHSESWHTLFFKAHKSFDDFSEILWPEQYTVEKLMEERQRCIELGEPHAYAQEYLNDPLDDSDRFFDVESWLPMEDQDYHTYKEYYIGVDFAISEQDKTAFTVFLVAGVDHMGHIHIVDLIRERGLGGDELIDLFFILHEEYNAPIFFVEKGHIFQTLEGMLHREMEERSMYLSYEEFNPSKDKRVRARPLQKLLKSTLYTVKFNKREEWWDGFESECHQFPNSTFKDQVDAFAWLAIGILSIIEAPTQEELEEAIWQQEMSEAMLLDQGVDDQTGY